MPNRVFNVAAVVSVVLLCFIVVAWFAAGAIDPRKQFVSLPNGWHLSINARCADARLQFFNDSNYGPYTGSVLSLAGAQGQPEVSGVGNVAGIYYRIIRWPDGTSLWTLSLSLIYPLLVTLLLATAWLIRRARRPRGGRCGNCEYNLTGNVTGRCSECGMPIASFPTSQPPGRQTQSSR